VRLLIFGLQDVWECFILWIMRCGLQDGGLLVYRYVHETVIETFK
jgi:hypothetical protein